MFGLKTKVVETQLAAVAVANAPSSIAVKEDRIPHPSVVKVQDQDGSEEWLALNKELGITLRAPATYELKAFLAEEGIPIYSAQSVFDYMSRKSDKWDLCPLRDRDLLKFPKGQFTLKHAEVSSWPDGAGRPGSLFSEAVPIPVLLTVKKLVAKFGDEVYFLVATVANDPFLAVVLRDSTLVFVERWDEPSFRG